MQNGKVSLVLQPDVHDSRPDTNATATGSDNAQFDIRAAMLQKIADGLMPVHPSRTPVSSRTLLVHICHAQEKQLFTKKGMHGQWDLHAEAALAAALLKPMRMQKSSELLALQNGSTSSSSAPAPLAIENVNISTSKTKSSPKNTKPNEAKAAASSSSSSSSTASSEDEQEESEDEHEETEDEQHQQAMPEYTLWTDDWHDVYAQVLQIYEKSQLNAKRRKIMDTLLADLRKAKSDFDAAV